MGSMISLKKELRAKLEDLHWKSNIGQIVQIGQKAVPALFSFLLLQSELRHRAAIALGQIIAGLYATDPETARNYIRQYMWHMNEDSGNIGWGIPEAFAETLGASPELAKEYAHILVSYIIELGFADNFCDFAPLRRSCYWAVGRLAQAQPGLVEKNRKWLVKGLEDDDEICCGMAAWALAQLSPHNADREALLKLSDKNYQSSCEIFDKDMLTYKTVSQLAEDVLRRMN